MRTSSREGGLRFLEALTKTIRGATHIHVLTTEEAMRRVGQRLTKEVLCIDASYRLPFRFSFRGPREELRRTGERCEWIESIRMKEAIAGESLADAEVQLVSERVGERFGVQQDVPADLSPSFCTSRSCRSTRLCGRSWPRST